MPSYKLATHMTTEGPRAGVDDKIFDLAQATGHSGDASLIAFYADWETAQARLAVALDNGLRTEGRPLNSVKLLAPLLYPGAIYCAGPITRITPPRWPRVKADRHRWTRIHKGSKRGTSLRRAAR